MKINYIGFGLFLALGLSNVTFAQTVATIGIGDISYASSAKNTSGRSAENIVSALSSGINAALLKTRKFSVLDYAQLTQRLNEQDLSLNDYYNKTAELGNFQQAGLDYILTASVNETGLFKQKRGSSVNAIGLVDVDFKLIGAADVTSDITSSLSAQSDIRISAGDTESERRAFDRAIDRAVDQLVDQVIAKLFPIRVMKISEESTITLNYGEGLLSAGDTILLFAKDQDVILNASGDAIGESVATLQVITSERKFATAQVLDGAENLELGQKGQLLSGS